MGIKLSMQSASRNLARQNGEAMLAFCVAGNTQAVIGVPKMPIDTKVVDINGDTALGHAILQRNYSMAKKLLDLGYSIRHKNNKGFSIVQLGCAVKSKELINLIIKSDQAFVDEILNKLGNSCVSQQDLLEIHNYFEVGLDPNIQHSLIGETPLMRLAFRGRTDFCDSLIKLGADASKRDIFGNTASYWAKKYSLLAEKLSALESKQLKQNEEKRQQSLHSYVKNYQVATPAPVAPRLESGRFAVVQAPKYHFSQAFENLLEQKAISEQEIPEKFKGYISKTIMNEPVKLFFQYYDKATLLKWMAAERGTGKQKPICPHNELPFVEANIDPAPELCEEMQQWVAARKPKL